MEIDSFVAIPNHNGPERFGGVGVAGSEFGVDDLVRHLGTVLALSFVEMDVKWTGKTVFRFVRSSCTIRFGVSVLWAL